MSDDKLPDTVDQPRPRSLLLEDVDVYIIEVTRRDINDVQTGTQHFILFLEDATNGEYVCSNVSSSLPIDSL